MLWFGQRGNKMEQKVVSRIGDMNRRKALLLMQQEDGDVVVVITLDGAPISDFKADREDREAEVEFCTVWPGRGRSQHTRRALLGLIGAMELDNAENPIPLPEPDQR